LIYNKKRRLANIKLTNRQKEIIELVKEFQPITSENIAKKLNVSRAALRPDLAILTMTDILKAKPKVGYVYLNKPIDSEIYEYIRKIKVKDIMSKPSVVEESTVVYDAIVHLFLNDVGTLFVENNGYLVGAISRKDFLKIAIGGTNMRQVPVGVIMTRMPNIILVGEEDTGYVAARKIIDHEVDSLPVVKKVNTEDKELYKIVGKVSKTNITKLFVKLGKNQ
jgi:CBS domain-containing protein